MKNFFYAKLTKVQKQKGKRIIHSVKVPIVAIFALIHQHTITKLRIAKKARKTKNERRLEIGPGMARIPGYETLNIIPTPTTDYVGDATRRLPFPDETFDAIYASHILEHVPWYLVDQILKEWVRVLKPKGVMEIWVPDGLKIAKAFVEAEEAESKTFQSDGWYKFNETHDPAVWFNGRIFSYGDGTGRKKSENWHMSVFCERLLYEKFQSNGLYKFEKLDRSQIRGYDHGWINLGVRGEKSEL